MTEFPPASTQSLTSTESAVRYELKGRVSRVPGISGRKFLLNFNKKDQGFVIAGVPSGVCAVIDLYGVCGQVGAERESLMSSWELRKE